MQRLQISRQVDVGENPGPDISPDRIDNILFALAIGLYLAVRLVGLADYPIYFFADEANQALLAADLVRDGFKGYDGLFLPPFFLNDYQYNLGVSVYLQVIPYLLFGRSVYIVRLVSVLAGLLAPISVGLILRQVFRFRQAWFGILLLSATPAWFLHSRTAFETSAATGFYAAFLYTYLRYRSQRAALWLILSSTMAALAFYCYSPMRMVILSTGVIILIHDMCIFWRKRSSLPFVLISVAILSIQLLRFEAAHPGENVRHLANLDSYWTKAIPLTEKLLQFMQNMLEGLNPVYWLLPSKFDIARHTMNGHPHLLPWAMPLVLMGAVLMLLNWRSPSARLLLLSILAVPTGAALVGVGITRLLSMVVPAALLGGAGGSRALRWLAARLRVREAVLSLAVFLLMSGYQVWMLRDALVNGPLWHEDYGLMGMQYGARQVFGEIRAVLSEEPNTELMLSSVWANGSDTLARFFFGDPLPFSMGSIDGYLYEKKPLTPQTMLVITPAEYQNALSSGKINFLRVESVLPYPNGEPGFFFLRASYTKDIDSILKSEREGRRALQEARVVIDDETVLLRHSSLDMGQPQDLFDSDERSVTRTLEANPYVMMIIYPSTRTISRVRVRIGGVPGKVQVILRDNNGESLQSLSVLVPEVPDARTVEVPINKQAGVLQVEILVEAYGRGEPEHVHVWEVSLQ